ncbi:MAG: hypothetical protein Q9198_006309 [Flavoplaca austrocitrina]
MAEIPGIRPEILHMETSMTEKAAVQVEDGTQSVLQENVSEPQELARPPWSSEIATKNTITMSPNARVDEASEGDVVKVPPTAFTPERAGEIVVEVHRFDSKKGKEMISSSKRGHGKVLAPRHGAENLDDITMWKSTLLMGAQLPAPSPPLIDEGRASTRNLDPLHTALHRGQA